MTELEDALAEVAAALDHCSLPYILIGGLAIASTGEARATLDVDVSVWTDPDKTHEAIDCLCRHLKPLPVDPREFVDKRHVLPVITSVGVRADIVFASLPVEREAIRRAVLKRLAGRLIPVASVEDLVLMKIISEREKDLTDARALLRRFRTSLDFDYLMPKLEELAEALAQPDILEVVRGEMDRRD
jgi:Nucleotidyl transferase AbiEii toxin, Type IV TA system